MQSVYTAKILVRLEKNFVDEIAFVCYYWMDNEPNKAYYGFFPM